MAVTCFYQNEENVVIKGTKDGAVESVQKRGMLREKQNSSLWRGSDLGFLPLFPTLPCVIT